MTHPQRGAHVGRRLADLMAHTHTQVRTAMLPHETKYRAKATEAFMEAHERGIAERFRAAFGDMLADPDLPDEVRTLFGPMANPEHSSDFFFTIAAVIGLFFAGAPAAAAGIVQRVQNHSLARWGELHLSPAEAAEGVVKGAITEGDAAGEAKVYGLSADRFAKLVEFTGDPPGTMQLLEAFRRGVIDRGRLQHGVRQGRIKNEWQDVIEALRFAPPGTGEVIAAVVENHLSHEQGKAMMAEAGTDPRHFDWLFETHGTPPGIHELLDLVNRGEVTEDKMRQAIRESRVKDKYVEDVLKLRVHLMPMRTVVSAVRQGVLDDGAAVQRLEHLGLSAEDAALLVREGHNTKTQTVREASASQLLAAHEAGMMPRSETESRLAALHFDAENVALLIDLGDHRRELALRSRAANRIGSSYIGHHIDRTTASTSLDRIGMNADERDHLIKLWDEERATNTRTLTEAQVVRLYKKGLIDEAEFMGRHVAMGYTEADAALLLSEWQSTQGG